jgi:hypothetical protein
LAGGLCGRHFLGQWGGIHPSGKGDGPSPEGQEMAATKQRSFCRRTFGRIWLRGDHHPVGHRFALLSTSGCKKKNGNESMNKNIYNN